MSTYHIIYFQRGSILENTPDLFKDSRIHVIERTMNHFVFSSTFTFTDDHLAGDDVSGVFLIRDLQRSPTTISFVKRYTDASQPYDVQYSAEWNQQTKRYEGYYSIGPWITPRIYRSMLFDECVIHIK